MSSLKPLLSAQMPISFAGTDFTFDGVAYRCSRCGETVRDDCIRGDVVRFIESVVDVNGETACGCGQKDVFRFRVRSDAVMQLFTPDGLYGIQLGQPLTLRERFKDRCRGIRQTIMKYIGRAP